MPPSLFSNIIKKTLWILYDHLGKFVLLNLLGWICAVLVIPFPPFYAALVAAANDLADYRDFDRTRFWHDALRYFWRSWVVALLLIIAILILISNYFFYGQFEGALAIFGAFWIGICLWLVLMLFVQQLFLLPIMIRDDLSVWAAFKKSGLMLLDNLKLSVLISALAISITVLLMFSGIGFVFLSLVWPIVLSAVTTREILRRYRPEQFPVPLDEEEQRTWRHVIRPWEP